MLLQAYDFLHLFRTKGAILEMGGDDQWSNILAGADLIRRVEGKDAFAMTFTPIDQYRRHENGQNTGPRALAGCQ